MKNPYLGKIVLFLTVLSLLGTAFVSCDDDGDSSDDSPANEVSYVLNKDVFTPNVMAPLEVASSTDTDAAAKWAEFDKQLALAKSMGVMGVSVDVWWGKVETADNTFDWTYYDTAFSKIKAAGLKIVPIMSFHQCGGNVGDDVTIRIPSFVWTKYSGQTVNGVTVAADVTYTVEGGNNLTISDELAYVSELGNTDPEVIAVWADELVKNEYLDFMNAFEDKYKDYAQDFIEINISCGPSGELRYPAYSTIHDSWNYPARGYLQCYSEPAKIDFRNSMISKYTDLAGVNAAWGTSYTSAEEILPPQNTDAFFSSDSYLASQYAKDFVNWYNGELVEHGKLMIDLAHEAFDGELDDSILGIKMPGIHWQMDGSISDTASDNAYNVLAPRAAEVCTGIVSSDVSQANGYGYNPFLELVASYEDVVLHFTCIEMNEKQRNPDATDTGNNQRTSLAKTLPTWVGEAAKAKGVILKGENALNGDNDTDYAWANIKGHMSTGNYNGITFLRMEDVVYGPSYDKYKAVIAEFAPDQVQTDPPADTKSVTVYFKPTNTEAHVYMHTWANGLNGNLSMVDASADAGAGWWKVVIKPFKALESGSNFEFGFFNHPQGPSDVDPYELTDSLTWLPDGSNPSYDGTVDTVYYVETSGTQYTSAAAAEAGGR